MQHVALAQLSNQIPSWLKALTLKEDGIPRSIEGVQGQWTHPLISFGSQGLFISSLPKNQADDAHKRFHTELNADHHMMISVQFSMKSFVCVVCLIFR